MAVILNSINKMALHLERWMNLEEYTIEILKLAKAKKYSNDFGWLMYGIFKEVGELSDALEHNRSDKKVAGEFGGIMHYLIQVMKKERPKIDLDIALINEIKSNWKHKKKTFNKKSNKIVRR